MKNLAARTILAIALCSFVALPSQAATIYFAQDGGTNGSGAVEAALPLGKLGSIPVPRGRLVLRGSSAEVTAIPEWQFDRHRVLYGPILDTRIVATPSGTRISGVMFFDEGEWLKYYDNPQAIETVNTETGITTSGHITQIDNGVVSITTLSGMQTDIPLASVTAIRSPRAFNFSIPASALSAEMPARAQATAVSLSPTATPFRMAALRTEVRREMDDGDIPTRKLVALGTFLSLVEIAQLTPYLVVPVGSAKLSHQMLGRQFRVNQSSLRTGLLP